MDLWRAVDGYCERLDPGYWAEPINAVTNLAFIVAGLILLRRAPDGICRLLCVVLMCIGVGSFLFHTHAQVWAGIADVVPIVAFVFIYIWAAHRYYWSLSPFRAAAATLAFIPFAALTGIGFSALPFFTISAAYWPVAVLIGLYAWLLRNRLPLVARGLVIGALILCLSLTARSLDQILCAQLPIGTHFLWHILNGVMLGWMIEVLARHLARMRARG